MYLLAAIGLIEIPKYQLLRARDAIERKLREGITKQGSPSQPVTGEANLGSAGTCMGTTGAWRCRR